MTVLTKIVPNLVRGNIGCGMKTVVLKNKHVALHRLIKIIYPYIPAGVEVRQMPHSLLNQIDFAKLQAIKQIGLNRVELSIGALGGGNRFIKPGQGEYKNLYLAVHLAS